MGARFDWVLCAALALALPLGCGAQPGVGPAGGGTPEASAQAPLPPLDPNLILSIPEEYRERPVSAEAGQDYFMRAGVGDPYGAGFPWPVFLALLELYPKQLGGDLQQFSSRFGFSAPSSAPSRLALPVGFHLTTDPNTDVQFLVMNCQVCHTDTLQIAGKPLQIPGMGSKQVRIHAYDRALTRIALDPRLDTELEPRATAVAAREKLFWPKGWRELLVRRTLENWRVRAELRAKDVELIGDGLPGRVETIAGFALALNHREAAKLKMPAVRGWTKIPDVAPWRYRTTNSYDGLVTGSPVTLVAEADFAFGVRPSWYVAQRHISTSMYLFLKGFERKLPFPGEINQQLARAGHQAFEQRCAWCHGHYGPPGRAGSQVSYTERVVPIAEVGTDPARLNAVTEAFIDATNAVEATRGLVLARASGGYVPRPLVNVWARGLYGHAGQWPDLAVLATPPAERPRRYVVMPAADYDLARIGTRTRSADRPAEPAKQEYLYDAAIEGFGSGGHEYLSSLERSERDAVLEYLKTL